LIFGIRASELETREVYAYTGKDTAFRVIPFAFLGCIYDDWMKMEE